MKKLLFLLPVIVTLACPLFVPPVLAAEKPLLDWSRLSLSAGIDYAWYGAPTETSAPVPFFEKEWEVGLYGAYVLAAPAAGQSGPVVSLAGSSAYGLDNKLIRTKVGLRFGWWPKE